MADTKKRVNAPSFTTHNVRFKFPKVNEPDFKYKKEGSWELKAIMTESDPDTQKLIGKLQPLHDKAAAAGEIAFLALPIKARKALEAKGTKAVVVNPLFSTVYDEETEEPTGEIEFKFALAASGEFKTGKKAGKKYVQRPAIFSASGKVIVPGLMFGDPKENPNALKKAGPAIWGGTVGKVSFEVGLGPNDEPGYFIGGTGSAGLSLRLRAVQIIDLVSGSARGAGDFGFGTEEGYEYEGGEVEADDTAAVDGTGAADDNEDF